MIAGRECRFKISSFDDDGTERDLMMLNLFRVLFPLLDWFSPRLAARFAVSVFYAPRRLPASKWEVAALGKGNTGFYEFDGERLAATVWGQSGPAVLLMHGWEGRRGQLAKIGLAAMEAGFRAVAIDGPAHGSSRKKRTTLVEFSQAIAAATEKFGPFHSIVGHSFGAAAAAIALRKSAATKRVVLISCPYSLRHVVGAFAKFVGVPDRSHEAMYPIMEKLHRCPESELSFETIGPDLRLPTMLIHDERDSYVPFIDGERVHRLTRNSAFRKTVGLGHMRILQDQTVAEEAVAFIVNAPAESLAA
jgi:pimeloyl-ACP methyl ester carboxylesterase